MTNYKERIKKIDEETLKNWLKEESTEESKLYEILLDTYEEAFVFELMDWVEDNHLPEVLSRALANPASATSRGMDMFIKLWNNSIDRIDEFDKLDEITQDALYVNLEGILMGAQEPLERQYAALAQRELEIEVKLQKERGGIQNVPAANYNRLKLTETLFNRTLTTCAWILTNHIEDLTDLEDYELEILFGKLKFEMTGSL